MNFSGLVRSAFNRFFQRNTAENSVSAEMQTQTELWHDIYINNSFWLGKHDDKEIISLNLPTAICNEFSRLIMSESVIKNAEKNFYTEIADDFTERLFAEIPTSLALGGMIFKPFVSHGKIFIDLIRTGDFLPVDFSDGQITSAIFVSRKTIGKFHYTLLEYHNFTISENSHTIINKVCKSSNSEYIGYECGFDEVPEWSGLVGNITFKNVKKPLFSYFRVPTANNIDLSSPLGISVYANAVDLIRQADEQWARIEWEYESKETALDVSIDMVRENGLPKRKKRIFRQYDTDSLDGNFYNIFSPEIRDSAEFNYLNRILQRIEFNVGLAYGTLSDPQTVEKTAEEIKSSKQRSYSQISAIQKSLGNAINNLFYAVSVYAKISGISEKSAEIICTWGDSVLEDSDKEFQRRLQMVSAGILKKEKFISWYFDCDESQANDYIPQETGFFGGE
ncbi:MAG: phage capsid protein [Ruminococcus sp.]|nr:phage capsid protein [Ruminococcus sp.]